MSQLASHQLLTTNVFGQQVDEIFTFEEGSSNTSASYTIPGGIKKVCTTRDGTFILSWSGRVYGIGRIGGLNLTCFSTSSSVAESQLFLFDSGGFEGDKFFADIVGGYDTLFLFSTENMLFAIGENNFALAGQTLPRSMDSLTRIVTFLEEDEYPVLAALCFSSSLIYTSKNRLFAMGQTLWFLGRSENYLPLTYESDRRIVSMSGAFFHAVMLDEDGRAYVCGEQSEHKKLGINETVSNLVPLDTIKEKVLIAHCACNHSIFVTESQNILLCGVDLSGNRYNNVPFLIQLEGINRLPMTFVTHISSYESRAIVHTNNGVFSNESIIYEVDQFESGCMTSELKTIPSTLFERGFKRSGLSDLIKSMRSSCTANRIVFYTTSDRSVVTAVTAFPRLFTYTTKMVLTNVDIYFN